MEDSSAKIKNIEKIGPGIHAVLFYRQQYEVVQAVRSYLKISLENNEKCIYIDQQENQNKVLNYLSQNMENFAKYLAEEQLLVLSREEIYGEPSQFKAVDIIELIKKFSSQAKNDGFKGLAITGELNGIMDFSGGKKEIIEYEWKLNEEIFTDYPVSALCRYNINKFDNEVIKAAVELHDYIIWEGSLNDNPYFIDPAGYKNNSVAEYEIKSWLDNIDKYQKKESHYQREIQIKEEEISASNQQLQAYNQEIMAMNEELIASVNELENLNKRFKKIIKLVSDIDNLNTVSEKDFLAHILNEAVEIVPEADFGSIYTFGEQHVNFVAAIGYDLAELKKLKINKEAFFNQKETIEIIDHQQLKNRDQENMEQTDFQKLKNTSLNKLKETMYLDLELNGEKRAGISLDINSESRQVFSSNSKKIFAAFYNIAASFYKLKDYQNLRYDFTKELISSTVKMLEMYDLYTRGHSENVAKIAEKLSQKMGLPQEEINNAYWAGLVHDIGKMLIPLEILNKESSLTKSEYETIKEHPVMGSNALGSSKSLGKIAKIVRHHHERWDGKGYPDGIQKEKIPIQSQILAAADAWDAMRSKRTYREPLSYQKALSEIKTNRGEQFAPAVTDALLELLAENKRAEILN